MSLQKALKYSIWQKKFQILRKFGAPAEHDNNDSDESGSNNDNVFESENDGVEILKSLAPTVIEGESEMSENNGKFGNDDEIESNGESENDEVSTDKEKGFGSQTYNKFSEYFIKQPQSGQRQPGF